MLIDIYILFNAYLFDTKAAKCYEHARDQGSLGSATGYSHSRTPRRFMVSL
jgi:hypothetical protein